METWILIKDYEDRYAISSLGRVKSLPRPYCKQERLLKMSANNDGYLTVSLCKNGVTKTHTVHRLVAMSFIENPNDYATVNHKDEVKTNNCVDNLEWCTNEYNVTYGTGRKRCGEKCSKKVLQLSLNGDIIKEWTSITSAETYFNSRSSISGCCRGKQKTACGYKWKYKEENNENKI